MIAKFLRRRPLGTLSLGAAVLLTGERPTPQQSAAAANQPPASQQRTDTATKTASTATGADTAKADSAATKLPPEALEALVAPIALYPDALSRRRSLHRPIRSRSFNFTNGSKKIPG